MAALPFNTTRIEELVLRFNAVMAKEGMDISDLAGNASDDEVAVTLQETEDDPSRNEITHEIESMNDEQKDGFVALFWIAQDIVFLRRVRHSCAGLSLQLCSGCG